MPGDHFELHSERGGYQLFVNGIPLKTPKKIPYCFPDSGSKMLRLYEESFHKLMPPETYFVFGTEVGGSFDSARFGPVKKESLIGRVLH